MRLAVFDTRRYDREALEAANAHYGHTLTFFEPRLTPQTARLASGFPAVCSFVNDRLDAAALEILREEGVRLVALRSAGYNHVDLEAADRLELRVVRVPEYSPYAVAEHAVALVLALNRRIHQAYARVRDWNFSLEGLVGFDLHGKTVGLIGTGRIGRAAARIFRGFGCRVLCFDAVVDAGLEREPAHPPDAPPGGRRRAGEDEARGDAHQHEPGRAGGQPGAAGGAQVGAPGRRGAGRVRGGGGHLLPGPVRPGAPG